MHAFCVYPWIHQISNNRSNEDQTRPVYFPDVNPSNLPQGAEFSMAAGDFLEIYQEPGEGPVSYYCFCGFPSFGNDIYVLQRYVERAIFLALLVDDW